MTARARSPKLSRMVSETAVRRARRADLLTPAELAELGGLELVARRVVEGFIAGMHSSPFRGFSVEFAEHRMYQPGDDLRHVDWRMYGRSDRYYVKQFEEETNLRASVLLDASASMGWSSEPAKLPSKLWYASRLAACIALLLVRQGDAVGLTVFDDAVRARIRPRGGRRHWSEIVRALSLARAHGRTETGAPLREVAARLRRRGLVVLVSDLLIDPDETLLALRFLRHRGHEVIVFHLLDPGEKRLPAVADARFVEPETGEEMAVRVSDIRLEYEAAVKSAIAEWQRQLQPHGIDYVLIETDQPLTVALRAYLNKRARLG
ncbi:MAG TPA: DUF58 domain-containing protein [Longimicrobiales bacterium]|nr:DUF58 domain-containing protein [Longimicrobiales bacterium]